jgi:hypothetical protein
MIDVIGSHLLMFIVLKPPKPKRLDMEPPEVPFGTNLPSTFSTLRIRGGMEHEPVDKYGTTVPKLSSSNFMWDGQPSVTLMKDIIYPLYMGLGSIQDRGSSLYETIKQIDKGGVLATPSRAVCLASGNPRLIENVEESKSRNRRAFCVIMNYTDSRCWHYKFFMMEFGNNAIDVVQYMLDNLVLPLSELQIADKGTYFSFMTMSKLNLPFNMKGYYQFLDKCIEMGTECKKTSTEIASKFVEGLPDNIASQLKSDMRTDITARKYIFPANYGLMTSRTFPASWAAKATPSPADCDYWGLADAHRNEWNILTKEVKAFPPKGFVRAAHAANSSGNVYGIAESPQEFAHLMQSPEWTLPPSDQEHVNLISADGITWDNECVVCFGKGHTAKCKRADGSIAKCLTLEFKTKPAELIPGNGKSSIKADKVQIDEPGSSQSMSRELARMKTQADEHNAILKAIVTKFKNRARSKSPSSRPSSRASAASLGSLPSEFDDHDDDADSVESQITPHFAEQVAPRD